MDIGAMGPHDRALWDAYCGDTSATVTVLRDDGYESEFGMGIFFREPDMFSPIEIKALELCKGRVLDVGAGAGTHSLELQKRGHKVLAIDIAPCAVDIMKERGVRDAQCVNIFDLDTAGFDTILLMMHGIGLVETLDGLDRFLLHARKLLKPDGILVFDSLDVQYTTEPVHLEYQEAKRKAGRYFGEICTRFEYKDLIGEYFSWLHVDPKTLQLHASQLGWEGRIIHQEPDGNYLACLTRTARSER
jgi:SAM-dependent methyltransferase